MYFVFIVSWKIKICGNDDSFFIKLSLYLRQILLFTFLCWVLCVTGVLFYFENKTILNVLIHRSFTVSWNEVVFILKLFFLFQMPMWLDSLHFHELWNLFANVTKGACWDFFLWALYLTCKNKTRTKPGELIPNWEALLQTWQFSPLHFEF